MGYQFQAVGSVGPVLVEHLVIDFAMLGTLIGLYKLPGVFLAFPSGLLGQRFGLKLVASLGLCLMAVGGGFTAYADTFAMATVGRVIAGSGAVLFNVLSAAIVANWFEKKELTLAMAIHVNSWPFGIALGLATQAVLMEATSLQAMMVVTTVFCAAGWLLLVMLYQEPKGQRKTVVQPEERRGTLDARAFALVTLAAMVWLLFNAGLILVVGFSPAYLVAQGLSVSESGLLSSIGTWIGIGAIPLGGYVVQRWGHADLMMVVFLLGGGCIAALIPWVDAWLLMFVLFGLIAWTPAGPIVALPIAHLTSENRATGIGIFFSYYYLGIGLFAPLAGWLRDVTDAPGAPLVFAGSLFGGALVFLGIFRSAERRLVVNKKVA